MSHRLSHSAVFIAGASAPHRFPKLPHPEVAFAGRSNVGKSSLLNRLVGIHRLARVSKTPGRTQQINFFVVDDRLTFVDLPGYGFARVPLAVKQQWKPLVESYLVERTQLQMVVVLIDLRRGIEEEDVQLLDFLRAHGLRTLLVATKADKLNRSSRARSAQSLAQAAGERAEQLIVCSAESGEGVAQLWQAIEKAKPHALHGRHPAT